MYPNEAQSRLRARRRPARSPSPLLSRPFGVAGEGLPCSSLDWASDRMAVRGDILTSVTRENKFRILLGSTALLATAYYVVGLMIINLYAQVLVFHVCWIMALAALWHRSLRPSFAILPNLLSICAITGTLFLGHVQLDHVCQRTYEEAQQVSYQRLGVGPGDCETERDPWRDTCWKASSKDYESLTALRRAVVDRSPGWCRATVVLARLEGQEIPRVINWTAADPLTLCGYPANRGFLPFPSLSFVRSRLRIEKELLASAEPLRLCLVEKMQ